ncbi:unnamed protein product [Effrenium voratum]|nr:unnamed protein product [Effrenium voratum]
MWTKITSASIVQIVACKAAESGAAGCQYTFSSSHTAARLCSNATCLRPPKPGRARLHSRTMTPLAILCSQSKLSLQAKPLKSTHGSQVSMLVRFVRERCSLVALSQLHLSQVESETESRDGFPDSVISS